MHMLRMHVPFCRRAQHYGERKHEKETPKKAQKKALMIWGYVKVRNAGIDRNGVESGASRFAFRTGRRF